jgi:hypothetical protein
VILEVELFIIITGGGDAPNCSDVVARIFRSGQVGRKNKPESDALAAWFLAHSRCQTANHDQDSFVRQVPSSGKHSLDDPRVIWITDLTEWYQAIEPAAPGGQRSHFAQSIDCSVSASSSVG